MSKFKLYFSEFVSDCVEVLIILHENNIEVECKRLEIIEKDDTKESWFREISANGTVPVLKDDDENVLEVGKSNIIDWVKKNSDKASSDDQVHPVVEMIKNKGYIASLTCAMISGLLDDAVEDSQTIRWPFHVKDQKLKTINALQSIQREEYDGGISVDNLMSNTLVILDALEAHLSAEDRVGIWLQGHQFGDSDCEVTSYLYRLYQVGLDPLWEKGERPFISLYVKQAFQRPSVLIATELKKHENEYYNIDKEPEEIKHARYAIKHSVEITEIYCLTFLTKNFVKSMFLLNKVLTTQCGKVIKNSITIFTGKSTFFPSKQRFCCYAKEVTKSRFSVKSTFLL